MQYDLISTLNTLDAADTQQIVVREPGGLYRIATDSEILHAAQKALAKNIRVTDCLSSPDAVKQFLCTRLGHLSYEVFSVVYLNVHNQVLDYCEMFRGTLTQAAVYPREVVKEALDKNATGVILCHCHPSGNVQPSGADEHLTRVLKQALALFDVRVLDHIIVGGKASFSMAEKGLL